MTRAGVLEAMGHAFFSLSLGMGAMITYGSYLDKGTNVSVSALQIVGLNTFYAIMAGLMVFPIVFTYNVDPGVGPGLFFITLPEVFARMPGGQIVGFFFFVMVVFAAITSSVSLLEVVVSYFIDQLGWAREKANYMLGFVIFLAGIPSLLSSNLLKDVTMFGGKNIFDSLDFLASNFIMPIGGLLTAVFVGWILKTKEKAPEIKGGEGAFHFYGLWNILMKYIVPVALVIVLLYTTGILSF
jgi:neurotransmitter:Na+ symporter, NSS family